MYRTVRFWVQTDNGPDMNLIVGDEDDLTMEISGGEYYLSDEQFEEFCSAVVKMRTAFRKERK